MLNNILVRAGRENLNRVHNLPVLLITGASGFIGRHLLASYREDFYIYAFARRSQTLCSVEPHDNIEWIQLDLAEENLVKDAMARIAGEGGVDFIIHLAGFYDFTNEDNPEFERTNVRGTGHILRYSEQLNPLRFIYASSLTVTEFDKPGTTITETSPCDAQFPYAVSKRKGEEMVSQYSQKFPCAILRLAAMFSDWCEYGPLYIFISTWLDKGLMSRILGGKGESAVPYMHVEDMNRFLIKLMEYHNKLTDCEILIPSTVGTTTHRELFDIAVKYYCRDSVSPISMPKWLASIGLYARFYLGKLIGNIPFERPWMIKYIDKKLTVDNSITRHKIKWRPVPRYHILRRMLFLLENMQSNPFTWHSKNEEALHKTDAVRPNLKIYTAMLRLEPEIIGTVLQKARSVANADRLEPYLEFDDDELRTRIAFVYLMLKTAVRTGDRLHVLEYGKELALKRFVEGIGLKPVLDAVTLIAENVVEILLKEGELDGLGERIESEIYMTNQLLRDEIEDSYERLTGYE